MFDQFDPEEDELEFIKDVPDFTIEELLKSIKKISSEKAAAPQASPTR